MNSADQECAEPEVIPRSEIDLETWGNLSQAELQTIKAQVLLILYNTRNNLGILRMDLRRIIAEKMDFAKVSTGKILRDLEKCDPPLLERSNILYIGDDCDCYDIIEISLTGKGEMYAKLLSGDAVLEEDTERECVEFLANLPNSRRAMVLLRNMEGCTRIKMKKAAGCSVESLRQKGLIRFGKEAGVTFSPVGRGISDFLYAHNSTRSTDLVSAFDSWRTST
ncbi:MAG: hypothetical protein QF442_01165 [Candidatus Peribacteraceae bacterium]|jgi:hypothetical protein|nr:hypothetical protein [Candidatus Peribacteraceae bacterium]